MIFPLPMYGTTNESMRDGQVGLGASLSSVCLAATFLPLPTKLLSWAATISPSEAQRRQQKRRKKNIITHSLAHTTFTVHGTASGDPSTEPKTCLW